MSELKRKVCFFVKILWKRIVVGEISLGDGEYTIVDTIMHAGTEYCLFVDVRDQEKFLVLKSTVDEVDGECWVSPSDNKEFNTAYMLFAEKYYSHWVDTILASMAADEKICDEAEVREKYKELTTFLIKRRKTITTMESATSGQLASLITDCEGSSAIFPGAYVTYCNEEKIRLGVPAEVIEQFSVYSKEVAEEMAKACKHAFQTDYAIGVTGTMGNVDPVNTENSIPGQVYFAICLNNEEMHSFFVEIPNQPTRLLYKLAVAKEVYDKLIDLLLAAEFSPESQMQELD